MLQPKEHFICKKSGLFLRIEADHSVTPGELNIDEVQIEGKKLGYIFSSA